ncbi:MAG: response regulator [Deltaproteobacteria bacterium]|nr:response regulator [Deltaproteobacteria bacterium]
MLILSLIPLASFFAILFVWFYIWASPSNTPVKRSLLFFAALDAPFLGFELLMFVPMFQPYVDVFFWLMSPFWMLLGFGFLNFAYRWTNRKNDLQYYVVLCASILAIIYFMASGRVYLGFQITELGVEDIRNPMLHALMAVPSIVGGSLGILLLWLRRQQESDVSAKRVHDIIIFGAIMTLSAIVTVDVILPDFLGTRHFVRLGSSMFVFFVLLVFLAMRRYRFLHFSIDEVAMPFFEKMNDAVFWVEDSGQVRMMNATARRWFGVSDRYEGTPVTDYLPHPEKSRLTMTLNGRERRLKNASYTILKNNLEMLRVFIVRDETEIHQARTVLREIRDELEKEATRRSERLFQAQRLEALATLSGGIAHEFNNLLTTIMGYTSAALDDISSDDPIREDFLEVLNAAERARDIVKQMLSFSDTDNREQSALDVVSVTMEALKLLNVSLPGNIHVTFEHGEKLFTMGNSTRLHQAVINLLTNAIHAMEKAGGALTVVIQCKVFTEPLRCVNAMLPPGKYISLAVSDTGCGIPPTHLARIFEPFFTTRRQGKGTGIGLATVFRVVEEHGGGILVQSVRDQGTTFELLLRHIEKGSVAKTQPVHMTTMARQSGTILLVDDNELVIRVTRRILEPLGFNVAAFSHPMDALAAFSENGRFCDMALLDYGLPTMNGIALAARIFEFAPQLPVILFSGKMTPVIEREAEAMALRGCLSKPLSKQQLVDAVMDAMSQTDKGCRP